MKAGELDSALKDSDVCFLDIRRPEELETLGTIEGYVNIPLDELTLVPILARHYLDMKLENPVVVAVDYGIGKRARLVAEFLDAPLAIVEKRRTSNDSRSELLNIIGEVKGKIAILVDDEIDTQSQLSYF